MGLYAEAEQQASLLTKVAARDERRREETRQEQESKEADSTGAKIENIWGSMKSGVEDMLDSIHSEEDHEEYKYGEKATTTTTTRSSGGGSNATEMLPEMLPELPTGISLDPAVASLLNTLVEGFKGMQHRMESLEARQGVPTLNLSTMMSPGASSGGSGMAESQVKTKIALIREEKIDVHQADGAGTEPINMVPSSSSDEVSLLT